VLPPSCRIGKILAKEKVLKQVTATEAVRTAFTRDIERIRVQYELVATKLNITPAASVKKIIILELHLNNLATKELILKTLVTAFRVPLFFEIHHAEKVHYAVWLGSGKKAALFQSKPTIASDREIPLYLSMEALYRNLLQIVLPLASLKNEGVADYSARNLEYRQLQQEIEKLEKRIQKEKQFNRRVELNRTLNEMKVKLGSLQNG
jgi:hypothetical protein